MGQEAKIGDEMFNKEKNILPAFPPTPHLPHKPNTDKFDKVATSDEVGVIFTHPINIEEKIDGASCGMTFFEDEPLIRNRDHILRKGYVKETAAKKQFASVWNWWYSNRKKFEFIARCGSFSVYGEWCVAQHGIYYNTLPDWFIAYDIYDYEKRLWLDPKLARAFLHDAGFITPKVVSQGEFDGGYENLEEWANLKSQWSEDKAEGIYIKVYNDTQTTHRFKMVREDFKRGSLWNPKKLTKNKLAQTKGEI